MEGSAEILSVPIESMDAVPPERRVAVLAHLLALQARIIVKMSGEAPTGSGAGGDRLMGVEEMARKLDCKPDWLRHNAGKLPFTRKPSPGQLRFSDRLADAWIAAGCPLGASRSKGKRSRAFGSTILPASGAME